MGARCFTWNNWRGSGKCEKPLRGTEWPAKGWLASVPRGTLEVDETQTVRLEGLRFRGRIQGQPSQDRRLQLQQARKLLAQWFSRNADEECSTRDP